MHASEIVKQRLVAASVKGAFLVWGYQVLFARPLGASVPTLFTFNGVHCALFEGSLEYLHTERMGFGKSGTIGANNSLDVRSTPDGLWLLMACPRNLPDTEPEMALKSAVAFFALWAGRNAVYDRYFEFSLDTENAQVGVWTPAMLNPAGLGSPDFTNFGELLQASGSIAKMPAADRTRLMFSMDCYYRNLSLTGAEAFVELWIAFESCAMNGTNVRSANSLLSKTYGIQGADVQKQLLTGRLQGIRDKIVHKGDYRNIQIVLIDYLSVVYQDVVLFLLLGLQRQGAVSFLRQNRNQVMEALKIATT